jgi:hypothetical protein
MLLLDVLGLVCGLLGEFTITRENRSLLSLRRGFALVLWRWLNGLLSPLANSPEVDIVLILFAFVFAFAFVDVAVVVFAFPPSSLLLLLESLTLFV